MPDDSSPDPPLSPSEDAPGPPADVLVIDADADVRAACRATLEAAGFRVREAADGDEGLAALRESPADAVVCDLELTGTDGSEVVRSIRLEFPAVPVVAAGGSQGLVDLLIVASYLGAAAVLPKPFDAEALLRAVRVSLRQRPG